MAFLLAIFPLMSTIPNPHHSFLVHLMNCYFPDFWYSHVTEKRTSEGRNAICECNQGDRNGGHLIGYGGLISEKANVPVPVATLYGQERNLLQ